MPSNVVLCEPVKSLPVVKLMVMGVGCVPFEVLCVIFSVLPIRLLF